MKQNEKLLPSQFAISIQDLQFYWDRHSSFLLDIQALHIAQGEKIFLQGSSGSGKSSLLNLLAGIHVPQSGDIALLGQSLCTLSQRQRDSFRAQHIGIIFQQFNLIPYLSVLDNVVLAATFTQQDQRQARAVALELLASLGVSDNAHHKAQSLSVGQQQRIAVARALINMPKIILADEPTSALDGDNRDAFMELLFASADKVNATLVFVSHDKYLRHLFDRSFDLDGLCLPAIRKEPARC